MDTSNIQPQIITTGAGNVVPNQGGQVIIQVVKVSSGGTCSGTVAHYKSRLAGIFAGMQIILAVISIIANALAIHFNLDWYDSRRIDKSWFCEDNFYSHIGYGFWSVILWILAGGFGLGAASSKSKCLIITFLTMSIIAAGTLSWYIPLSLLQISFDSSTYNCRMDDLKETEYDCPYYNTPTTTRTYEYREFSSSEECIDYVDRTRDDTNDKWDVLLPMDIFLVLIGFAELVASVTSAALCCKAACCCRQNTDDINGALANAPPNVRYIVNQSNQQAAPLQPMVIPAAGTPTAPMQDTSNPPEYTKDGPPAYVE